MACQMKMGNLDENIVLQLSASTDETIISIVLNNVIFQFYSIIID